MQDRGQRTVYTIVERSEKSLGKGRDIELYYREVDEREIIE